MGTGDGCPIDDALSNQAGPAWHDRSWVILLAGQFPAEHLMQHTPTVQKAMDVHLNRQRAAAGEVCVCILLDQMCMLRAKLCQSVFQFICALQAFCEDGIIAGVALHMAFDSVHLPCGNIGGVLVQGIRFQIKRHAFQRQLLE